MKTLKNIKIGFASILLMLFAAQVSVAQTYNLNNASSELKIEGTSNIHDWEINAEKMSGKIAVETEGGQLIKMEQIEFEVVAESLKSGKNGMDKNTYKALDTDKHPKISFKLSNVNNIDCISQTQCKVTVSGNLTIAGTTKPVELVFDTKVNGNKITISGQETLKMTTFNVDPPTAVFGTIKTGDEVTVKYNAVFNQ